MSRSLESRAEERKEVSGRNLELSRGYAAEGSEGTSLRSQAGLWRTYLLKFTAERDQTMMVEEETKP